MDSESLSVAAVVAERYGGPESLTVRTWRVPPPGRDEIRIRVQWAGISHADLLMIAGLHPERRRPPFVPGWDVVGVVEAIGAGVRHVGVGDRVAALSIVGGWAQYAVVPAAFVVPVPPGPVAPDAAVCLVMDYVVAYQMLTRTAAARAGDTVLVQGVGGGVGTALLQTAGRLGVRVLGTDRDTKRSYVQSQGGTLIDFERVDVVTACRQLTDGRGVDVAYDGIGATARQSLRAVRPGGRLVWFGMLTLLAGGIRDTRARARTVANVAAVFAHNLLPGGKRTSLYSIQTLARRHPDWYRQDLATLLQMLANKQIDPQVTVAVPRHEAPAALARLARGEVPGKQVIAGG